MNLTTILQMQKDRSNGVVLSRTSIDLLIEHAISLYWQNQVLAAEIIGMNQLKSELTDAKAKLQQGEGE